MPECDRRGGRSAWVTRMKNCQQRTRNPPSKHISENIYEGNMTHDVKMSRCEEIPFSTPAPHSNNRKIYIEFECQPPRTFPMKNFIENFCEIETIFSRFFLFTSSSSFGACQSEVIKHRKLMENCTKTCTNCNCTNNVWIASGVKFSLRRLYEAWAMTDGDRGRKIIALKIWMENKRLFEWRTNLKNPANLFRVIQCALWLIAASRMRSALR